MSRIKSFGDSLLSALCIIVWFVIAFKIIAFYNSENFADKFFLTCLTTISIGVIGGMALHFYSLLKRRTLKYSFVYNLFGTLNIMAGIMAMGFHPASGKPIGYLGVACFAVGIIMYRNIYVRDRQTTSPAKN